MIFLNLINVKKNVSLTQCFKIFIFYLVFVAIYQTLLVHIFDNKSCFHGLYSRELELSIFSRKLYDYLLSLFIRVL